MTAYMLGMLFLPVADYPLSTITASSFTVDVIGGVLPSNLGWTKIALVPMIVLVAASIREPARWSALRPVWPDAVVAVFCVWPLFGVLFGAPVGTAVFSAAYLACVWGGHWLLARVMLSGQDGDRVLIRAIAWSGVALLIFAVFEAALPPWMYSFIYGAHPFQTEGAVRYLGYRPMGLLEHGNQYAIWMALSALAWVERLRHRRKRTGFEVGCAIAVIVATFTSQSVGAIALFVVGVVALAMSHRTMRLTLRMGAPALALLAAVYLSGVLPVSRAAWEAAVGPVARSVLQSTGRESIGYRIRRDQMALPMIYAKPVAGYGVWDWWRPLNSHPWGLPLLLAGQFGLVSLALCMLFMFAAAARAVWNGSHGYLTIMTLLAGFDAALNSYLFFPAIFAAAVLASRGFAHTDSNRTHRASSGRREGSRSSRQSHSRQTASRR